MIGQRIAHFRIVAKLGEGGMGAVYLAEDTLLKREVALKVLPETLLGDPERLARFQREAETLAALNHPNIVAIYSVEQAGSQRCLIMERIVGQSLAEAIPDGGLSAEAFYDLAGPISDALAAAHGRGIVHRDLKPANVMVSEDGAAKVLDLGLAKLLEDPDDLDGEAPTATASPTALGVVMGTVGYMSPEQAEGRPVGPQSDVFSLGTLFYEMLTGVSPFRRDTAASSIAAILGQKPEPLRKVRPDLPSDLQTILARCLAKDPEERYPSAAPLRDALVASRQRLERRRTGLVSVLRRPAVALTLLGLVAVGIVGGLWYQRGAEHRRWAREEALPEIERLIAANFGDYSQAYALAVEAERYIPDDPELLALMTRCSLNVSADSEPNGAEVSVRLYGSPEDEWRSLGTTPVEGFRLPVGVLRWRFEKPGFEPVMAVASTWALGLGGEQLIWPNRVVRTLDEAGAPPPGTVRVAGGPTDVGELGDFFIDRLEVTNRQFKEFIDAGGYRDPGYWKHPFVLDGAEIDRDAAMSRFVDETGLPGPATWNSGAYPDGQSDHPVTGVSWYEAAAYAEFRGASLPTAHHWGLASGDAEMLMMFPQLGGYKTLAPFSNFDGHGTVAVGSLDGPTAFGALDMAGNVREWCSNDTPDGGLVRGGSWSDATYMFGMLSQVPRMDRSPQNGLRCAYYPDPETVPAAALAAVVPDQHYPGGIPDPVPDEIFEVYRERFAYDRTELDARIEARHEGEEFWVRETVTFAAAYGDERVTGHLFLPRNASPPYQTVVYFPGGGSIAHPSSADIDNYWEVPLFLSFLMQNGRAVFYPVYKGTFERKDPALFAMLEEDSPRRYTDFVTELVRDLGRSIDYLETRDDIDADRLAYYGLSWGGLIGPIATAIEDRFQASVILAGGLAAEYAESIVLPRAEVDPAHYAPRVRTPTLMINGRYDLILPLDLAIRPLYERLGTPPEHKKLKLYDTDHIPPRNEFVKETLAWLDRYLGPVAH